MVLLELRLWFLPHQHFLYLSLRLTIPMELLPKSVSGLVSGYPDVTSKPFRAILHRSVAPKDFGGEWLCTKLGCGGWGCAYCCEQSGGVVVFKVPRGYEGIIESSDILTVSEN